MGMPTARDAHRTWKFAWRRTVSVADRAMMGRGLNSPRVAESWARPLANWGMLMSDLMRLPVWRLSGGAGNIVYAGNERGAHLIKELLLDAAASVRPHGRVPVSRLGRHVDRWLSGDADLVICETSPLHVPRSRAVAQFAVPEWVNHVLDIPSDVERLIAGKRMSRYRNYINRALRNGFAYRYTRSPAAFEDFHYRIYSPFVERRHGELGRVTPYHEQKWWFERSGLLQVFREGEPVAGAITYLAGDTCMQLDIGALDGDEGLTRQLNKLLVWFNVHWAHSRGAVRINLGGTRPWRSNGSFRAKRKWGARVVRRQRPYRRWHFYADAPSAALCQRMGDVGLVTESKGRMQALEIANQHFHPERLEDDALRDGLQGVQLVTTGGYSDTGVVQTAR